MRNVMYHVFPKTFLSGKEAVILEDTSLVPYGYPALTFEVTSGIKVLYRMVSNASKIILYLDGKLELTIAVPASRELDWEAELKRLSITEPLVVGNSIVYTILLDVTVTPLSPSHSQIAKE